MLHDLHNRRYVPDEGYPSPKLRQRITDDSLTLVQALGYDMNTVEWAVKTGCLTPSTSANPAPDMEIDPC
ncbi:MAG: hypothetical protein U0871_05090 [Gemmataceae bacterium]